MKIEGTGDFEKGLSLVTTNSEGAQMRTPLNIDGFDLKKQDRWELPSKGTVEVCIYACVCVCVCVCFCIYMYARNLIGGNYPAKALWRYVYACMCVCEGVSMCVCV